MVAENWNVPYHSASVQLSDLTPHPKNPTIARFFTNMGFVEELGVGRRTLLKYGPAYFDGREPVISEENVFSITIPYKPTVVINGSKDERLNERLNERLHPSLQATMEIISSNPGIQRKEIVSLSGKGDATIGRHLAILMKMGRIEHRDSKKTGGYYPKL
jgi:ATP-dependent DNA helicase RecG